MKTRLLLAAAAATLVACGPNNDDPENLAPDVTEDTSPDVADDVAEVIEPLCGDGVIDDGEACDTDALGDAVCEFGGTLVCADDCTLDTSGCQAPPSCGDGVIQPDQGEDCDGDAPFEATCDSLGEGVGELVCSDLCAFDTSGCAPPAACGDGVLNDGEECDDGNTEDGDGCSQGCELEHCGDGILQEDEACDGAVLVAGCDGQLGVQACDDCTIGELDCPDDALCGDGALDFGEACDDGNTEDDDDCSADCAVSHTCNDGVRDPHEACDGDDLAELTCQDLGFRAGELRCSDCALMINGCYNPRCGNGRLEDGEACDDGGRADGDGCDAFCELEPCFDPYPVTDESSPEVLDVPTYVDGRVVAAGESDWYQFALPDGASLLLDADGDVEALVYVDDEPGEPQSFPFALSSATTSTQLITLEVRSDTELCEPYRFFVSYDAPCGEDDRFEENDTFDAWAELDTLEDQGVLGDADLYEVEVPPGCGVNLIADGAPRWTEVDGTLISTSDRQSHLTTHINGSDTSRTVRAYLLADERACGDYGLGAFVSCECPTLASAGRAGQAIELPTSGGLVADQVASPLLTRSYSLDLCAGGTVVVRAESDDPPSLAFGVDGTADILASGADGVLAYASDEPVALAIYAAVEGEQTCARYDLDVQVAGCACENDSFEPNDDRSAVTELSAAESTHGVVSEGDTDWFVFDPPTCASGGGNVYVTLQAYGGEASISAFGPEGQPLGTEHTVGQHGAYVDLGAERHLFSIDSDDACVSYALSVESSCTPLCREDQHVVAGACVPCEPGTIRAAGDTPLGPDTACEPVTCGVDERVFNHVCVSCPAGEVNEGGDDASGADTTCDPGLCAEDEHVVGGACVACPAGSFRPAGDDPSGDDTACDDACTAVFGLSCDAFEEAYIKASNPDTEDRFGTAVAIHGDTLVVGAPNEASVDGTQDNNGGLVIGAVYVFVRSGGTWSQQAYLKSQFHVMRDSFGAAVAIHGDTLVVGAPGEWSGATGIDGAEDDFVAESAGAVFVFSRSGGVWSQSAYIKASNTGIYDDFGAAVAYDGATLVVGAPMESSAAGGPESDNSVQNAGAAYVFTASGGVWSQEAILKASNAGAHDRFGSAVDVEGDVVVVGAPRESSALAAAPSDDSLGDSGAVYVFRRSVGVWTEDAMLKAPNAGAGDQFGTRVALDGSVIAVSAPFEDGSSPGIDGPDNDLFADAGAVYLFGDTVDGWVDLAYVKASNPGAGDTFGSALDLQGMLVVGAERESSEGTGLEGCPTCSGAFGAGAVYLFNETEGAYFQLAYIKGPLSGTGYNLGSAVAIDDATVVAGQRGESSNASGVGGDFSDTSLNASGAALVWRVLP